MMGLFVVFVGTHRTLRVYVKRMNEDEGQGDFRRTMLGVQLKGWVQLAQESSQPAGVYA